MANQFLNNDALWQLGYAQSMSQDQYLRLMQQGLQQGAAQRAVPPEQPSAYSEPMPAYKNQKLLLIKKG